MARGARRGQPCVDHPDGPANYVNTYDGLDQEGTYTFRFYVEATLPDGSPFDQVMTISRWVGVDVDPITTPFSINMNVAAPAGMNAALVSVQPIDAAGQYLGPFSDHVVDFRTTTGSLQPVPDRFDGTYVRLLVYPKGAVPVVTMTVQGKALPPIVVATGCLGLLLRPFLWRWRKILALTTRRKKKEKT